MNINVCVSKLMIKVVFILYIRRYVLCVYMVGLHMCTCVDFKLMPSMKITSTYVHIIHPVCSKL